MNATSELWSAIIRTSSAVISGEKLWGLSRSSAAMPTTTERGVRSSWDTEATNSSFDRMSSAIRRFASSSCRVRSTYRHLQQLTPPQEPLMEDPGTQKVLHPKRHFDDVDGLGQEVRDAQTQRLTLGLGSDVRGQHDHGKERVVRAKASDQTSGPRSHPNEACAGPPGRCPVRTR